MRCQLTRLLQCAMLTCHRLVAACCMHCVLASSHTRRCTHGAWLRSMIHNSLRECATLQAKLLMQATSNGELTQPRMNADLVGDLLALDDAPSTAGNASAAVDMLADLLGDGGPSLNASGVVAGGSQVNTLACCEHLCCKLVCCAGSPLVTDTAAMLGCHSVTMLLH